MSGDLTTDGDGVEAWMALLESGQEPTLEHEYEFRISSGPVADVIDLLQGRNGVLTDMSKQGWKLVTTTSHLNRGKLVYCDTFRWGSDETPPELGTADAADAVDTTDAGTGAGDEAITAPLASTRAFRRRGGSDRR